MKNAWVAVLLLAVTLKAGVFAAESLSDYSVCFGDRYLLAGSGEPGSEDGSFLEASIHAPAGLAVSADGTELFVAEAKGHRIRVVSLNARPQVRTLVGGDQAGYLDGDFSEARLDSPGQLALDGKNQRLYVLESKKGCVREIDLVARRVRTVDLTQTVRSMSVSPAGELIVHFSDSAEISGLEGGRAALPDATVFIEKLGLNARYIQSEARFSFFRPGGQPVYGEMKSADGARLRIAEPSQIRPPFKGPLAMAFDSFRSVIYVAETSFNRIYAVKAYRLDFECENCGREIHHLDDAKPLGTRRILFVGDSMVGMFVPVAAWKMSRRFEWHLNHGIAERGLGLHVEADDRGGILGQPTSPMVKVLYEKFTTLKKQGQDEVFMMLHSWNLLTETLAFVTNPTLNGLPERDNLEWSLLPLKKQLPKFSNAERDLIRHLLARFPSVFSVNPKNGIFKFHNVAADTGALFSDSVFVDAILKRFEVVADKCVAAAEAEGIKVRFVMMPMKPHLMGGEHNHANLPENYFYLKFQKAFAGVAAKKGYSYFDLTVPVRLEGTTDFPLMMGNEYHLGRGGHDLYGRLLAEWYLREAAEIRP